MSAESKKEKQFQRAIYITLNATPGELCSVIAKRARELKFQRYHYVVFEEEKSATQSFSKFLVMTVWEERPGQFSDDLVGVFSLQLLRQAHTLFHVPPSHAWDFKAEQEELRDRGRIPGRLGVGDFNHFTDEVPFIAFLKLLFDEFQRSGFISVRGGGEGIEIDRPTVMSLIEIAVYVEVPYLKKLHRKNDEFALWKAKMDDILKEAFGKDSDEYHRFVWAVRVFHSGLSEAGYQEEYRKNLTQYETALKSIVQKHEILGVAETGQVLASEDAAQMANFLFDKMQLHPKVIEASKALFEDGHYPEATFAAFRAVENFVKKKSRLSTYGTDLMSKVFNAENPVIKLKTTSDQNEQEGFKFLFMGAMLGIRNPKAHVNVVQRDPYRTLEYLGFASMLIRRAE